MPPVLLLLLLLVAAAVQLVVCDETSLDETFLEDQKRSAAAAADGSNAGGGGEQRYDLVLALIEKYLKEKSSKNLEKENTQNFGSVSPSEGCSKLTELSAADEGSINYPRSGPYLSNEYCQWKIRAPVDKAIELTVRRISIEATEECRWDKLEIFDGSLTNDTSSTTSNSLSLASLCGFILPTASYVTSSNEALIRFTSDGSVGYGGFQIDFRPVTPGSPSAPADAFDGRPQEKSSKGSSSQTQGASSEYSETKLVECKGVKELKEPTGVIKFPMSGDYENNVVCKWRIIATGGKLIQIQVTSIDIEEPDDCHSCCWYDWLSLYDGRTENATTMMAKLCGTVAPLVPFTTKASAALVVFRSNAKNGDEGFQLNYRVVAKDKAKSGLGPCTGQVLEVRDSTGVIQSPGFKDDRFPENSRCRWRIVGALEQVIRLRFDNLNIENDIACVYDSVSVFDGFNRSAPLLGRFCGNKLPPEMTSSGSSLLVSFETDDSMSDGGFSLTWTLIDKIASLRKESPGCSGETAILQQNEGIFTSPNYGKGNTYPNAARCSWRIVVDPSMRVFLRFEKFSLEPPLFDTECYDSVSVYDGPDETSHLLGSYCGVYTPNDIMASGNQLYISFKSDKSTKEAGFLARYSAKNTTGNVFGAECGISDIMPKVYSRIVGGVEATPHSWPWQVSVKYSGHNWRHWCGASILYPHWVITAAHCVHGYGPASNFRIVLGEHNQLVNEGTEKELSIKEIIIHEKYDSDTNDNDIALFRLPEDVQFNRYIKPICLPKEDVDANVLCITTGWGDTKSTGNESLLNQVYVPVVSRIQCNEPNWYAGQLTDNMICAGYPEGRKDSCQGDSGGPMVCLTEGRWKLLGLTSWGYDCALSNHPGIYTRVTRYLGWIQAKTNQ